MFKRLHSEALLLLLLFGLFSLAVNVEQVKPVGTVYIWADGSVDPLTASIFTADDETYALTDKFAVIGADGIIVERDNIGVDGAGHSIQGAGTWSGILTATTNVVNVTVQGVLLRGILTNSTLPLFPRLLLCTTNRL